MNKKALIVLGVVALIAVIAVIWFATRPNESEDTIEIGAVLPLTGDVASYGQAGKRGIDLAVKEINDEDGINGKKIKVIYEDDEGKSAKGVAAMQKLASVDKVPLVVGSAASSVSLSMCPVANREKVILISPISSSKELTEQGGPHFFRVCPSDVVQAGMMAEWLKEEDHRRAAVIFVNNSWGRGLKDEFVSDFKSAGGDVVAVEACKEGDRDLRAQITKVQAENPDVLYGITYGREGGALLRQAKELAFEPPIYGADVWGSPELLETAKDAADGIKIIVPGEFHGPKYEAFVERFEAEYGEPPDTYASYAYDLVYLIAPLLAEGARDDVLRKALSDASYDGVTGPTSFDKNGDVVEKEFRRKTLP